MEIRCCKRCNQLYKNGNDKLCPSCNEKIDEIMLKVKSYLEDHPQAGIEEVSKSLQESEKDILLLLREGRLSIRSEQHRCSRCGRPNEKGRYCGDCVKKMRSELNNVLNDFKHNTNCLGNEYKPMYHDVISNKGEMYTNHRRKEMI